MVQEHNAELITAVRHLYGQGIITADKDIADRTGYDKTTISPFLSGKTKMSKKFKIAFEKEFKLSLEDFATVSQSEAVTSEEIQSFLVSKITKIEATLDVLLSLKAEEAAGGSVTAETKKNEFRQLVRDKIQDIQRAAGGRFSMD